MKRAFTVAACLALLGPLYGCQKKCSDPAAYKLQSPASQSFGPNGGTGNVQIDVRNACTWYVDISADSEDWVRVSSAAHSGAASVPFTVNPASQLPQLPLPRTGHLRIIQQGANGSLFTIAVEQK